jgi:flagellar secretion chaperone FliS
MSYGAFAKQAARYREAEVLSASPAQLVVIVYDHLLVNMRRARLLIASENASARSDSLERARAALTELLVTLDRDKGGELADRLASIYTFMLAELSTLGVRPNAERLDALLALATELRDAFAQASQGLVGAEPAVAATSLASR